MREILALGNRIYHHRDHNDFNIQRLLVFWVRGLLNSKEIIRLYKFFKANEEFRILEASNAIFYEQMTRHVFYYKSTLAERRDLIERHFEICQKKIEFAALQKIYYDERLLLWTGEEMAGVLSLGLDFFYVDRKEGLMTLDLMCGEMRVYHITFWLRHDLVGKPCLCIGALQGSLGGRELIHDLTKEFFGCRPKNFIFYGVQILAQELGVNRILAVSNQGFYTSNHLRMDRKLKTSLDNFWQELGGYALPDARFYELPLREQRKTEDKIVSKKRNLYRKRYALLDEIGQKFRDKLRLYLNFAY